MRVASVEINNFRSIEQARLELGQITLLVGRNNTGKSAAIRALHALQATGALSGHDPRLGALQLTLRFELENVDPAAFGTQVPIQPTGTLTVQPGIVPSLATPGGTWGVSAAPSSEPGNVIYPYLAGRKVPAYEEQVDEARSRDVRLDLSNLAAKVDRLSDVNHPMNQPFRELVDEVIGLPLSAIASGGGKQVGMWVNATERIWLSQMGDGVSQMLGLICQLCMADGKLFLIEELENDIHPEGLKALLRVIEQRSGQNQFVLSTHSNLVVRHLGGLDSARIYEVTSEVSTVAGRRLSTTSFSQVERNAERRVQLLARLGYELSDFDLYDGFLILEESSAERLIRDHLIRWFAPQLARVRTVGSRGTSDIPKNLEALTKLVLFTHLQGLYHGRLRVFVDGEPSGAETLSKLRTMYPDWPPECFQQFSQTDFELYFPERFQEDVKAALSLQQGAKRHAKHELLQQVLSWIAANEEAAKAAFEESASEVISKLREFERVILRAGPID